MLIVTPEVSSSMPMWFLLKIGRSFIKNFKRSSEQSQYGKTSRLP